MFAFLSRIFSWLGIRFSALFGQGFLVELAKWTVVKIVVTAFCTVGIYIVASNLLVFFVSKIIEGVTSMAGSQGSVDSAIIQISGLGAYFAERFKIVPSFSLIVTGFSIRAIRQFLPF